MRRVIGGNWHVVELREGYRMVSWWPPLSTSLVIPRDGDRPGEELVRRLELVRIRVGVLRVLGGLGLVSLVIMVPVAIRWWGGMGFLGSLAGVVLGSLAVMAASYSAGGKLGLVARERLLFALPRINPFSAPAGGEALLERAVQGARSVAVARLLLDPADFEAWMRPVAYDVVQGREVERGNELVEVLGRAQVEAMIATRPTGVEPTGKWCPRCGAEFGPAPESCPTCEVRLTCASA